MQPRELLLLVACIGLLGGLRLTSTTTTTTFVAAMSIANQDLERFFRTANATQSLAAEERIALDMYTYAFLNYSFVENNQVRDVNFNEEKARYGEGKILSVRGKLVHISDADNVGDDTACSANILGTNGFPTPAMGVAWIALVRRGHCTFEEKVKNVHAKGAAGVIIYNDKPVTNLEKMQIKGKTRNITAVITYQEIGLDMASRLDQGTDVTAIILEGRSGMRPINSLNRTSVLFVSISFIVLMVISLVWLIFYYIQRFRYLQTKDQQSRHLCSATKKAIMKIPTKTGKSTDDKDDVDSDCCAICIEAYKPSDLIRVLPCKHEFHKSCIDPWLIEHRTCPMCKLDVLKFYGFVFLGSEESILEYDPNSSATESSISSSDGMDSTNGALTDLGLSRNFVMTFPRLLVLEANAQTDTHDTHDALLPPRSQSSMSFTHAKDQVSSVVNKLEDQHDLRHACKGSAGYDMKESRLSVLQESIKTRRSRSADDRYSSSFLARKQQNSTVTAGNDASASTSNSGACGHLTEPSFAQSFEDLNKRQHRSAATKDVAGEVRDASNVESFFADE